MADELLREHDVPDLLRDALQELSAAATEEAARAFSRIINVCKGSGKGSKGGQRNSYSAGYGQAQISIKELESWVAQSLKDKHLLPNPQPKMKSKGKKKKQHPQQNKGNPAPPGIFAPFGRCQGVAPKETYGTRVLSVRSRVTRKIAKMSTQVNGTMAEDMFVFWPMRACTSLWVVASAGPLTTIINGLPYEGHPADGWDSPTGVAYRVPAQPSSPIGTEFRILRGAARFRVFAGPSFQGVVKFVLGNAAMMSMTPLEVMDQHTDTQGMHEVAVQSGKWYNVRLGLSNHEAVQLRIWWVCFEHRICSYTALLP